MKGRTQGKTTRRGTPSRKTPDPVKPSESGTLHDRIAARAYEIYERRTRQGPLDDWLQAEEEIIRQQDAGC